MTNTKTNQSDSAQHTLGTWIADFDTVYVRFPNERNEPAICEVFQAPSISIAEMQANANLIAAAPDLLRELIFLTQRIADSQVARAFKGEIADAEAVIAKAKGGRHA